MKLDNYELMRFNTIWGLNFGFSTIIYALSDKQITAEGMLILLGSGAVTAWIMCKVYKAFKDTGDEE